MVKWNEARLIYSKICKVYKAAKSHSHTLAKAFFSKKHAQSTQQKVFLFENILVSKKKGYTFALRKRSIFAEY
jgi:predicted secreted protein